MHFGAFCSAREKFSITKLWGKIFGEPHSGNDDDEQATVWQTNVPEPNRVNTGVFCPHWKRNILLEPAGHVDEFALLSSSCCTAVEVFRGGSCQSGSHLGWHDGALIGHHIYMTEQSHGSFTWRIKSVTYRYVTINYVKSSFMTLYLHKKHLQDGSLV